MRADNIKIAEVHDCFTIAEIIATEDLGFFAPGTGHEAAEEGLTARHGPNRSIPPAASKRKATRSARRGGPGGRGMETDARRGQRAAG